jgi:hypothetical protein
MPIHTMLAASSKFHTLIKMAFFIVHGYGEGFIHLTETRKKTGMRRH